jgi:predicted hotdog family 3-hydroxylacyl-ACP dehydratase
MNNLELSGLTIEDLLPHRGDMLLVEEVLAVDNKQARTLCRSKKSWPMADATGVPALILVELAAQTAGVCNGWDRIQTKGLDSEKMGWLVGIKKAEFLVDHLLFGSDIITRAETTYSFENLREVHCEQHIDDKQISTITLQLFQAPTDE